MRLVRIPNKILFEGVPKTVYGKPQKTGEKYGVVVIDMQPRFIGGLDESDVAALIECQRDILITCKENNIPILIAETINDSQTIDDITEVASGSFTPNPFYKNYDSAFTNNRLPFVLSRLGVSNLVIMGINTSACIVTTAYDAKIAGYNIVSAQHLTAQPAWWRDRSGFDWLREEGRYFDDHNSVIDILRN